MKQNFTVRQGALDGVEAFQSVARHRRVPGIELELAEARNCTTSPPKGFDAGVRMGRFIAADMVVVRLRRPFPFVVVGSPRAIPPHSHDEL